MSKRKKKTGSTAPTAEQTDRYAQFTARAMYKARVLSPNKKAYQRREKHRPCYA